MRQDRLVSVKYPHWYRRFFTDNWHDASVLVSYIFCVFLLKLAVKRDVFKFSVFSFHLWMTFFNKTKSAINPFRTAAIWWKAIFMTADFGSIFWKIAEPLQKIVMQPALTSRLALRVGLHIWWRPDLRNLSLSFRRFFENFPQSYIYDSRQ